MKNGCKDFISPTMDKIKIEPYHENRLHDMIFAQCFLRVANNRGKCIEDSMNLMQELREYIVYLYRHIEQLEKDKRYLLEQRLKRDISLVERLNKIKELLKESDCIAGSQEFGLSYGQAINYLEEIKEVLKG